jgi:hypothetical protein
LSVLWSKYLSPNNTTTVKAQEQCTH